MSVVDQLVNVFLYLLGVGYEAGDVFAAVAGGEDDVVGVDFGVPKVAEYLGSAPAVHYGVELAVEAAVGSGGGFDYLVAAVAVFRLNYFAFKKGGLEFLVGYLAVGELLAALEVDFFLGLNVGFAPRGVVRHAGGVVGCYAPTIFLSDFKVEEFGHIAFLGNK